MQVIILIYFDSFHRSWEIVVFINRKHCIGDVVDVVFFLVKGVVIKQTLYVFIIVYVLKN